MYALINTFDRQPNSIGTVLSLHRSEEAADAANRKYQCDIKRSNGRSCYLPTMVSKVCQGRWRKGDAVRQSELA